MAELSDNEENGTPRVRASIKFVRNLGNFESVHVELGVERDVPDGVSYLVALRRLFAEVDEEVGKAVEQIDREAGKVNVTEK